MEMKKSREERTELWSTIMFEVQEEKVEHPVRWEETQKQREETAWRPRTKSQSAPSRPLSP